MKRILPIFLIFTACFHVSSAQQNNPLRLELNANLDMESYNLVPCGEEGLLVFYESPDKGSEPDTYIWHFAFYDKLFRQKWLADTALISGVKFSGYDRDGTNTYLAFHDAGKQKTLPNLQVLKVDYELNRFEILNYRVREKADLMDFRIVDQHVLATFNNESFEPFMIFLKPGQEETKEFVPDIEGMNLIQQVYDSEESGKLMLVVDNYIEKRQNAIYVIETGMNAEAVKTYRINPALENKVINEARIAGADRDTLIIMGTYSNFASRVSENTDETGQENTGYFISKFIDDKEVFINYYNFLEFEEMYRALNSNALSEVNRKAQKHKKRGEEFSLDYTLLLHDVIPFGKDFVLLAEAYYPEYRTVTNMYYDYYGRPIPQTYTVFDGYHYTSGVAAAFSADGSLVWDDGIDIHDIMTFDLDKYLSAYVSGDEIAFFYSSTNHLYYKIAGHGEDNGPLQHVVIESKYRGDKVMEDLGSKISHWYGNYFLCYGYQKIRNNRVGEGKRTVFYISKMAFN